MNRVLLILVCFAALIGSVTFAQDFNPNTDPDLLAYWSFDEESSYLASLGYGYGGEAFGDAEYDTFAKIGSGALALDGDGDYIQTELLQEVQEADEVTVAAWFYTLVTESG